MDDIRHADIRDLVADHLGVNEIVVDTLAPLIRQAIGCDDLDVIEIIIKIEERYGIRIEDTDFDFDVEQISVHWLTTLIDKKLLGKFWGARAPTASSPQTNCVRVNEVFSSKLD